MYWAWINYWTGPTGTGPGAESVSPNTALVYWQWERSLFPNLSCFKDTNEVQREKTYKQKGEKQPQRDTKWPKKTTSNI